MKRYIMMAMVVAGSTTYAQNVSAEEPTVLASAAIPGTIEKRNVTNDVTDFLTEATDARLIDIKEGSLAKEKGTTSAVQEYGETMIKDQRAMLAELRKIAALRGVTLPEEISQEKKEGRDELAALSGEKFDRKFLKMMIKDHKRDLKQFSRAVGSDDEEVSEFAELYIPLIQSHLARAKALKRAL